MMLVVRNQNDWLLQRGNNIPFDNKCYFAISLPGDLRSLSARARCLLKRDTKCYF